MFGGMDVSELRRLEQEIPHLKRLVAELDVSGCGEKSSKRLVQEGVRALCERCLSDFCHTVLVMFCR